MGKIIILLLSVVCSTSVYAELMTVKDIKEMLQDGDRGELSAISYVQGIVDGMLGMDTLHHKEKQIPYEFCKLHAAYVNGVPERHPAFQTKKLVAAWEKQGYPMSALMVDMILTYMTDQYGCKG